MAPLEPWMGGTTEKSSFCICFVIARLPLCRLVNNLDQ